MGRSCAPSAGISAAVAPTRTSCEPAASPPSCRSPRDGTTMPRFHVDRLRTGDGAEDEYRILETVTQPAWGADATLDIVGRSVPRVEGPEKVTGRARYAYDVRLPGQVYARVLRSPLPHARVRRIDVAKAEALPGVHAVLCADNAPEIGWYRDSFLFDRTLRFVGEEVAAVAAVSERVAEDALRLIEV